MFGDERGEKSFSLMHLYVKTVCMTQYKTFKQFVGLFLYLMFGIIAQGSFEEKKT